jgi:hypothetical protein
VNFEADIQKLEKLLLQGAFASDVEMRQTEQTYAELCALRDVEKRIRLTCACGQCDSPS